MAKHDGKFDKIQANEILSYEQVRMLVRNILTYSEELTLDDLDLVYKKYVDGLFENFAGGGTFVDHFETNLELLDVPIEEIPLGGYAYVGTDEDFTVYFWNEISETWVSGGGGAVITPEIIRDALQSLIGNNRLDASAIKNLPQVNEENRVLDPGTLTITSPTSLDLLAASWLWNKNSVSNSGTYTLPTKPTDPNNQFVIITVGASGTPVVEAGVAEPTPSIPNPVTPGDLVLHTIYRPHDGEDVVIPTTPTFATKVQSGQWAADGITHLYAPIWSQVVLPNTYYGFNMAFCQWTSDYTTFGQQPKNGFLFVSFVTAVGTPTLDPNRVAKFQTVDISVSNGDFVLVQEDGSNVVTVYAKKGTYLGNMVFDYILPKFATVKNASRVNGGTYSALPPTGIKIFSTNGVDYVPSTGNTIRFDKPRVYGPLTGNLTISTAYANAGYMAEVVHNAATEPAITVPSGVTLLKLGGEYSPGDNNIYLFVCRKGGDTTTKDGNGVVSVWYTISQNTL